MASLTAIVITKDEERHVRACLSGLTWADEVIVLDSFSTDRTVEIARQLIDKVFQHPFISFPDQRNAALGLASKDWVFFVDADERLTPELIAEIRQKISEIPPSYAGYWMPRRNIILGKWIRYAGWFPDYQLRLVQRSKARYDEARKVHEVVVLQGSASYLTNPCIHFNYEFVGQLFSRQHRYAALEARTLFEAGRRAKPHNFVLQPLREFRRRYILLRGWRDGFHGLFLSLLMAWYQFLVYIKLARIRHHG